jgi:serine kinase of HPr protein (carbohydrate metabolism regulator)
MNRMPVAPGRSIANLVEVAARNQLLRARGHHAARRLADRLEQQLQNGDAGPLIEPDEAGEREAD